MGPILRDSSIAPVIHSISNQNLGHPQKTQECSCDQQKLHDAGSPETTETTLSVLSSVIGDLGCIEKGMLRQSAKHLLLLPDQKFLLAEITTGPAAQCITGGLVFEMEGVEVVGEGRDCLVHAKRKVAQLLQDVKAG